MEVLLTGITNTEIEVEEWKQIDVDGKKKMKVIKSTTFLYEQTRVR
jgi:hypothetical protein